VLDQELQVRMMNDLSGALVLTYDEMDRTLPPGWRESASDEFRLTDMVDPSVAAPMTNVTDKMRGARRWGAARP
jgi:hypothetical protein